MADGVLEPYAISHKPSAMTRASVLVFTAIALAGATVRAHRRAVGAEAALRLGAPVGGAVVLIVEGELVGVRTRRDEHPFVPDVQAVHAGGQFWRGQMIHKENFVVLRSTFCS